MWTKASIPRPKSVLVDEHRLAPSVPRIQTLVLHETFGRGNDDSGSLEEPLKEASNYVTLGVVVVPENLLQSAHRIA